MAGGHEVVGSSPTSPTKFIMETSTFFLAFGLTMFAGLSTGIGSLLAFFTKRTNKTFLSIALGFSAGVMLYVSFVEMFATAKESLILEFGDKLGYWIVVISFLGGIFIIALIDRLVPDAENPHEMHMVEEMNNPNPEHEHKKLLRMGLFTALVLSIHNFPEGLATFMSTISDPSLGIAIAVAIAIHNIPEGIAVSVPIYYATGSRKKAFWYSFLSGLAEPLGAIIGCLILAKFCSPSLLGVVFAGVAGVMVFISLDELLPVAREFGKHHLSIYGMIAGMTVMAISLLLFA